MEKKNTMAEIHIVPFSLSYDWYWHTRIDALACIRLYCGQSINQ